jgi:hypothetical protein
MSVLAGRNMKLKYSVVVEYNICKKPFECGPRSSFSKSTSRGPSFKRLYMMIIQIQSTTVLWVSLLILRRFPFPEIMHHSRLNSEQMLVHYTNSRPSFLAFHKIDLPVTADLAVVAMRN